MTSRYRLLRSTFCRVSGSFRSIHNASVKVYNIRKSTKPCVLAFSLFTWLGFEKKLTAEDELVHTIKHCILFIQRNEYEKAEQLLHVALRQAQQIRHELGITYVYDVMANLALQREELDKAKQLFIAVTQRIMADGAQEDDPRVIHLSVKLARVSHLKKDYSTAQLGYDWCIEKLNRLLETDPSDATQKLLAMAEDWYGRLFVDLNKCEEGLKLMKSSLNRMRLVPDMDKEEIVYQLNDIGTVCDSLGLSDDSITYFKEAIELAKSAKIEDVGTMYVNLGRAYINTQLLDAARKSCGYAWKLGVMSKNQDVKQEAELCIKQINNLV
ncbi:tetratricopeptide repeat protein 19 homolog, mitochondrial [Spodoptera frugiperda]|uniref:Tetratricopeptide repeat protein 19 homolog, mitochondrial n=1 Tax=Spodoptera frugiperda TaxID=7108 RepID=A0A9R0D0E1_SPOFR|nr:tetratricopeptide repeat protein 19 homolog, mitochondrial [Spodoptera frugiperda]